MTRKNYRPRGRDTAAPEADPELDRQIAKVMDGAVDGKPPTLEDLAREVAKDRPVEQVPPRPMAEVWFRGDLVTIHTDEPATITFLCLLALQDARIDAILTACPFKILDAHGEPVWPQKPKPPEPS